MKVHEVNQRIHPIISELKEKLQTCRKTLLELLNEWYFLKDKGTQNIMFTYETLFGDLEFEIHNKSKTASELERRVELLSLKLRKGEKLSEKIIDYINMVVKNESLKRKSMGYGGKETENFNINVNNNINSYEKIESVIEKQYEAPQLYRYLVKKMHPDINGNNHLFNQFWLNVQDAYKTGDVERLRLFYESICNTRFNKFQDLRSEEISLRTEIRQLELNIENQKKKIINLKNEEPFTLKDKLTDKYWINRRKMNLEYRLSNIDRRIVYNKTLLKRLTQDKVIFGKDYNLVPRNNKLESSAAL